LRLTRKIDLRTFGARRARYSALREFTILSKINAKIERFFTLLLKNSDHF